MVDLKPFRGWRYDPGVAGDLDSVLCPPYDLITPEIQSSLRRLNPYNVVHLEAGEGLDWDAPEQQRYSGTASLFEEWTRKGVLKRDPEPSYYLSRQIFNHKGSEWSRLGLTACVGLEQYESRQVLPHEYTEAPAIRDRVSLMESCNANFSPIMALYRDAEGSLSHTLQQVTGSAPDVHARDGQGSQYTLWRVADADLIESLNDFFLNTPIFLADGHHRYEAALQYRQRRASREPGAGQAHNYVMMTLICFDDPGLLVLPYHRLLGGLSREQLAEVEKRLFEIFEPKAMDSNGSQSADGLVEQVADEGLNGHALAMVAPGEDGSHLLTPREGSDWQAWGPLAVSEAWILEEQVLKPVLGEATLDHLGYIHGHQDAVDLVASGAQQRAFLLKPFPMDQFEAIVSQGRRLPRKSTFFYPKLPTGFVLNQLEGAL